MEKQIVIIQDALTVEIQAITESKCVMDPETCILTKVQCELIAINGRYILRGYISLLDHQFKLPLDEAGIDVYHDKNLFVMLEIRQRKPLPRMYRFSTTSSKHRLKWTQTVSSIQTRQRKSERLSDSREPIVSQTRIEKPSSNQISELHPSIQPKHRVEYLVLIRHGHYTNAFNSSSSDTEQILSNIGKQQARLTGKHLANTLGAPANRQDVSIHHSDMTRAVETASIISRSFADCTVQVSSLLREGWPGSPFRQKTAMSQKPATYRSDNDVARMSEAISRYLHSSSKEYEERIRVIICHANLIRSFICHVLGVSPNGVWGHFEINHCSITRFELYGNRPSKIISLNEVGHLPRSLITSSEDLL